jgi:hypothetical protein
VDTIARMTLPDPVSFPPVEPGEDLVVSATTFVSFERCPDQAAARLRGIYGAESRSSFVGGLAHRIFARHLRDGPIPDGGLESACREEIGGGMNAKLGSLGMKPSELSGVIREVAGLYQRFKSLGVDGFEGAEVFLEVVPSDGVTLRGSVDAVFGGGQEGTRLVDWKTGGLESSDRQLAFYAMLWALEKGEPPGVVEAVSVATGERIREVPTRAGIEETAAKVASMISRLRTAWSQGEDLARIAGPWCSWCPLLEECAEGQAATAILERR